MSRQRSKARYLAVQAIYQWQLAGQDITDIIAQFLVKENVKKFEQDYFSDLVLGVAKGLSDLDKPLSSVVDRAIESIDPVERAILRMAAYELMHHPEIPYRVIINESVELAKTFGAEQGHRYVNGVLDKLARELRSLETQ